MTQQHILGVPLHHFEGPRTTTAQGAQRAFGLGLTMGNSCSYSMMACRACHDHYEVTFKPFLRRSVRDAGCLRAIGFGLIHYIMLGVSIYILIVFRLSSHGNTMHGR